MFYDITNIGQIYILFILPCLANPCNSDRNSAQVWHFMWQCRRSSCHLLGIAMNLKNESKMRQGFPSGSRGKRGHEGKDFSGIEPPKKTLFFSMFFADQ